MSVNTTLPPSWEKDFDWRKFNKPKQEIYLSSKIDEVNLTTEIASLIFGVVAASTFVASYFFTASLLTPLALGAFGLAILALVGRILLPELLRSREVTNIKEFVEEWNPGILLEGRGNEYIPLATYLDRLPGSLIPMRRGVNGAKNEEKDCLAAIDYLAQCARLHREKILAQPFIQTRALGKDLRGDVQFLRSILQLIKENASLSSKTVTSAERREMIALAEELDLMKIESTTPVWTKRSQWKPYEEFATPIEEGVDGKRLLQSIEAIEYLRLCSQLCKEKIKGFEEIFEISKREKSDPLNLIFVSLAQRGRLESIDGWPEEGQLTLKERMDILHVAQAIRQEHVSVN